ncbi:hypothetical protein IIW29_01875 [Candidatus Saccharibacteria bacterium]|nr:hypothetical protein [Candidatus Saccharibacteria bacterium]
MIGKKKSKMRLRERIFGFFFAILAILGLASSVMMPTGMAYADPVETTNTTVIENNGAGNGGNQGNQGNQGNNTTTTATTTVSTGDSCKETLGAIGWLVCPTTGAIAGAVDFLYGLIQDILAVNPVEMKDGLPIYEIWKYFRGFANIVFIIFLIIVIYSQITGLGISNYGVKKALPKLIVVAVLVNLSFLLCSLAVDLSNIAGNSIRGVFTTVMNSTMSDMVTSATGTDIAVGNAEMFSAIAGGTALAIGGTVIAFETGAIWMLIPVVLGAIIAVVTGLITIALRQAVIVLLVMIAPLAVVAHMLPNTENLFTRWRKIFVQMLVFYPVFSLLFGASSLAGFAIIASATDGFGVLLGVAVQIFPLFFAWKLMQMSGTVLGTINAKLRGYGGRTMVGGVGAWANSRRLATKQKSMAKNRATTPSLRLMQFATNRKVARDAEMMENIQKVKNRGLAYRASRNYDKRGIPTKQGMEEYESQAKNMEYQQIIERDKNNMNKGLGQLLAVRDVQGATKERLKALDTRNVLASDALKFEQARGEKISADNAEGFYKRAEAAVNWHMDTTQGFEYLKNDDGSEVLRDGQRILVPRSDYKMHFDDINGARAQEAALRYNKMNEIMEGDIVSTHYAAATAAHAYDTQKKIIETKYQKYFDMVPPTKDLEYRLGELTKLNDAANYIDTILPGLRILNQRGDTDVVRKQIENVLNSEQGIELGTHASQALASFLMFEVKGGDPFLRRYGKYINLETAHIYNKNQRQNKRLTLDEFVTGEYDEIEEYVDPSEPLVTRRRIVKKPVKKTMTDLIEGTALDQVERTAYSNLDEMLVNAYTNESGLDVRKYLSKREEMETAMGPAFVTASLRYESGSEQLKSAVGFLTGYDGKGGARWDRNGDLASDAEYAEGYFRERTMNYLRSQTPTQILGLRSDYKNALMEHLVEEYLVNNPEKREEFNNEMARIQNAYGDENAETAEEKRSVDREKLKMELAGRQMRRILGSTGKLEQIYKTRRSGAANNAKDWLREWVGLDNEVALKNEVDYYKRKRQEEWQNEMRRRREADPNDVGVQPHRVYTEADQAGFQAMMSELNEEYKDDDVDVFFEKTKEQLEEWFPDSYIVWAYDRYHEQNRNADNDDLYTWVREALNDLDNYPGNDLGN